MTQIFGDFTNERNDQEYLIIGFSPTSIPLKQRWRNSGLSADFLADYLSTFFPTQDGDSIDRQAEVKDAVSYIANELLENAMKFSHAASEHPVSIGLHLQRDLVRFYVTNSVDPETVPGFKEFIQELLTEDPYELYIRQLERNAEEDNIGHSGLGFLTMMNDYDAQLAWKFDTAQEVPKRVNVTTMVQLFVY
ncbi:MAG: slr1658 superfamily regulator [Ardenticatenaceae bacterium]